MELMTDEFSSILLPWINYIQIKGGVIQVQEIDDETGEAYSEDTIELTFKKKNHLSEELSMTYADGSGVTVTWTINTIEATITTMNNGFDMCDLPVMTALEMIDDIFPSSASNNRNIIAPIVHTSNNEDQVDAIAMSVSIELDEHQHDELTEIEDNCNDAE